MSKATYQGKGKDSRALESARGFFHKIKDRFLSLGKIRSNKVDAALVINLSSRPQRMERIKKHTKGFSFPVIRVDAISGANFDDSYQRQFCPNARLMLSRGQVACFLSHKKCWQQIIDSNLQIAWILEDDAQINYFVARHIDAWLEEIERKDPEWELIYTSRSTSEYFYELTSYFGILPYVDETRRRYDKEFTKHSIIPGPNTQADGYLVSRKGAKKLLKVCEEILYPVDIQIPISHKELNLYAFSPLLSSYYKDGISDSR